MFENLKNIFKKNKKREMLKSNSKDTAKERLHLVLMQDRANVSADFLDLMRKEIIEVIKKYIDIDEKAMDVRLTTETNEDGVQGAPALYANIPIINIKDETRRLSKTNQEEKIIQDKPPKSEKKEEAKQTQEKEEESKITTNKEQKQKESENESVDEKTKEDTNNQTNEIKEDLSKKTEENTVTEDIQSKENEVSIQKKEIKKEINVKEEKNNEE